MGKHLYLQILKSLQIYNNPNKKQCNNNNTPLKEISRIFHKKHKNKKFYKNNSIYEFFT
jgi:hypothetical protein